MFTREIHQKVGSTSLATRHLLKNLESIERGYLKLVTPSGECLEFKGKKEGVTCEVTLCSWNVFDMIINMSDIGLGEAYIKGLWSTPSLPNVLVFICQNEKTFQNTFRFSTFYNFFFKFRNFLRKNSKVGSRRNIIFHYDLGNEFYELWLDPSMTYSSGLFENEDSLLQSQKNKMDKALSLLSPDSNASILEVGCGWGSFLEYASEKGHKTEGITISPRQKEYCQNRLKHSNANVSLLDYRDLKKSFDHIVSIEMFEAVGHDYWNIFMEKLKKCLNPKGSAVIQTITIRNDLFDAYRKSSDFIRSHIFPGGFLPSQEQFKVLAEKMSLRIETEISFGDSYEKTLRNWYKNFNAVTDKVKHLGFDDQFIRTWQYYLAICIAGFATGRTNVHQFKLVHP